MGIEILAPVEVAAMLDDGWTIVTADGSLSTQFED
jgi:hypothetical protein